MIPKFDVYHEELHSSYISFEKYKIFLQTKRFNGYIKLEDREKQYFFFIKDGQDIGAFLLSDGKAVAFDSSKIPPTVKLPCYISSYKIPQQVVDFFARCHQTQLVIDKLPFDSVEFEKFFSQIDSKKVTGFLEALRANESEKYIYFYGGKIFGYMNIKGNSGYFEKNLDKNQIQMALKNSTIKLYSLLPVSIASSDDEKTKLNSLVSISNSSNVDENRLSVLNCYEEIFQMLERSTISDKFTEIWRTSALELSNKYLFLNPFAGEFNYDNGKLDLWEKIDIATAIQAMDELINVIAKKANLPKDGIKEIKDNYLNILAEYEIRN